MRYLKSLIGRVDIINEQPVPQEEHRDLQILLKGADNGDRAAIPHKDRLRAEPLPINLWPRLHGSLRDRLPAW